MHTPAYLVLSLIAGAPVTVQEPAPAKAPAQSKAWDQEPDSYRGMKWGTTVASATEVLDTAENCVCYWGGDDRSICKAKPETDPKKIPLTRTCISTFNVGSVKVKDYITFANEALVLANWTFDSDDYDKLRGIFVEKYGEPKAANAKEIQNRMGASFQQEELEWEGTTALVSLRHYGSKLTEGSASIGTRAYRDQVLAEAEAEKKKGSKAF